MQQQRPLGDLEVRITRVITVRTNEVSDDHNPAPTWEYGAAPAPGYDLRIEAEAGSEVVSAAGAPYTLVIHAMCMSRPVLEPFAMAPLRPAGYPFLAPPNGFIEAFTPASGWHRDPATGTFRKDWVYHLPSALLNVNHLYHSFQYVVSLVETPDLATGMCRVAVTTVSDPFLLI